MFTSVDAIRHDIAFAQHAMVDAGVFETFESDDLICEVYHQPAHNRSTVYVRVYDREGQVYAIYARPEIHQLGWSVYMGTFEQAMRSNQYEISEGRIVCGIRHVAGFSVCGICQAISEMNSIPTQEIKGLVLDDATYYVCAQNTSYLFIESSFTQMPQGKEGACYLVRLIRGICSEVLRNYG